MTIAQREPFRNATDISHYAFLWQVSCIKIDIALSCS